MIIGIPKGLLYYKYKYFLHPFFEGLGAKIITSNDTNKDILDAGINCCTDEACLPIKIFHGHVHSIKEKCDLMIIPRIMSIRDNEYICPKFCGLPEMIISNIDNLPVITYDPIYLNSKKKFYKWCYNVGSLITKNKNIIRKSFNKALQSLNQASIGIDNKNYQHNILLTGHPCNIYDDYINMNISKKLNDLGVGIKTEETVDEKYIDIEVSKLYKKPFWTFARNIYGASSYLAKTKKVDGIIYISSFSCGIDSVVIELVKESINDFPLLILKIDEQTGEAGFNTRIEAFIDMLYRRNKNEINIPPYGEHLYSSKNIV